MKYDYNNWKLSIITIRFQKNSEIHFRFRRRKMNKVVLIGRLTRDPELKTNEGSGKVYSKFTLAVDRNFQKLNPEKDVDFIPVCCFGRTAENLDKYMKKGNLLSVMGRLQFSSYEAKDGSKRYSSEVIADEIQFLENKRKVENV